MDNPVSKRILSPMEHESDIVIVGGGLNGPTLALALAQSGFSVTIVDAVVRATQTAQDFDGRSYALALASVRLLDNLGLWEDLAPHSQAMLEIKVSDGRAGDGVLSPFFLHFDHTEIEEGPMGHMLEDRYLRRRLATAVDQQANITLLEGETVVDQAAHAKGVTATLSSGRQLTARLLIGCDGRMSGTASRAGLKRNGWDYGQTALVCAIDHAVPHAGTAHQFFMPPGPLAILPLPGNQSSIVWSETHANAKAFNALPDAEYLQILRPRFGDFLGEIALAGKRFTYPLSLSLAESFVAERVALVGDAAHGMHPIAGQGLNAGMRDIAALVQTLKDAQKRGEDFASSLVLDRYQQWRRFDTSSLALATDLTNKLFSNDNPLLRLTRDIGMGAINAIPSLRRSFIREAAGLTGDLPDLMR
ncbi:MAG: FAD-dependent monooxygenase [Thalassovita sp.]